MNPTSIYHTVKQLVNGFSLKTRLKRVVSDFTLGVLVSQSCRLSDVAQALSPRGKEASQYRRLQRYLANPRVEMNEIQSQWAKRVIGCQNSPQLILLVDETALSDHLKIMVVGLWQEGGCVPLAWCCYRAEDYPQEGQVRLIERLLKRIMPGVSDAQTVWLLADRGIGTSPELMRAVQGCGGRVLFRVQGSTRFRDANGAEQSLQACGTPNYLFQNYGRVFKKAGWLSAFVHVLWQADYDNPWCLVSSDPILPSAYGLRFQQECAFRDLKSDGFQWQSSHVWLPSHADRLLLILTLAYWVVLNLGQRAKPSSETSFTRRSIFRWGCEAIRSFVRPTISPLLPIPPPFVSSVV